MLESSGNLAKWQVSGFAHYKVAGSHHSLLTSVDSNLRSDTRRQAKLSSLHDPKVCVLCNVYTDEYGGCAHVSVSF